MPGLMDGKRVLVTGVRNEWSIAWWAALSLHREGAQLAFSVFSDREIGRTKKLLAAAGIESPIFPCDATDDEQVAAMYAEVGEAFGGKLDGMLHAIGFADKNELRGEFAATSKAGFGLAHESSAYTLVSLTRGARELMRAAGGGSVVTLTYLGSERVVPNYNVMGVAKASLEASTRYLAADLGGENIRVNAVSAGPIKTLAASGIADFDSMLKAVAERAPLRRAVTADEVGDVVLFLMSTLARGVTGEVLYVDGGYNITGM